MNITEEIQKYRLIMEDLDYANGYMKVRFRGFEFPLVKGFRRRNDDTMLDYAVELSDKVGAPIKYYKVNASDLNNAHVGIFYPVGYKFSKALVPAVLKANGIEIRQ